MVSGTVSEAVVGPYFSWPSPLKGFEPSFAVLDQLPQHASDTWLERLRVL